MNKSIYQFEKEFIKDRKMTQEIYRDYWITLPCCCNEANCKGYAVVNRTPKAVLKHINENWKEKGN